MFPKNIVPAISKVSMNLRVEVGGYNHSVSAFGSSMGTFTGIFISILVSLFILL